MNWYVLGAVIVAFFLPLLLKRIGTISEREARSLLDRGATLVDVRTEGEFRSGHLPGAINLPLAQLRESASHRLTRDSVVLVHCQSGSRSQVAKRVLRALGYQEVHNLGSYGRAERITRRAPTA